MDAKALAGQLDLTAYVIEKNAEGITHEESMQHPEPAGNSLNWVLGHIVRTRNETLPMLGLEPLYDSARFEAYDRDYPLPSDQAVEFDDLMACLRELQAPLHDGILALTAERLEEPAPFTPTGNPDETVGSLLTGLVFHEAYHAGQTGLLRRLLGKPCALPAAEAPAEVA